MIGKNLLEQLAWCVWCEKAAVVLCGAGCESCSVRRCAVSCVLTDSFVAEHNKGTKQHIHSTEID